MDSLAIAIIAGGVLTSAQFVETNQYPFTIAFLALGTAMTLAIGTGFV